MLNSEYIELVCQVREDYQKNHRKNSEIELGWCDKNEDDNLCQEINLWTYWQGWKYAERNSKIKILLLGQDWGNPYGAQDTGTIKNVCLMNQGIDVPYLHDCILESREAATDRNLIDFFAAIHYPDIDCIRYPDLFFTNFNLGYRTTRGSGGMTEELMEADAVYVMRLINILKPEKILCLGELVTKATAKLLFGTVPKYKDFNTFVDDSGCIMTYHGACFTSRVYPLFHPGYYGVNLNRTGGYDRHIKDWERIIDETGH
jgi:hypothetical protein